MSRSPPHSAPRYGLVAITLHWLLAVAIVGAFCVGVYMADLPFSIQRIKLINYHKWAGLSILVLTLARLLWRLSHPPPPLPDAVLAAMPPWQRRAHHVTHTALYALCVAVPLAGWAHSSAAGMPIVWFGMLPLPDLWPSVDKDLAKHLLKPLHAAAAFTLIALVLLHVAAALKHQWLDRDGLLLRMIPWSR
jgi:cytochrome b561